MCPRISSKLSAVWSTSTRTWKSSCEPTSKLQGKVHVTLHSVTLCSSSSHWIKEESFTVTLSVVLSLGLWVCNVWSWFACSFQVGDHGADGRVTGDIIWAALPLGSEWVQYTELIPQSHFVHIVQRELNTKQHSCESNGVCRTHLRAHVIHILWLSFAKNARHQNKK